MLVHDRLAINPQYRSHRLAIESFSKGFTRARRFAAGPLPIIRIPVVVHVVHHSSDENVSMEQIRGQIAVLNRDFRKANTDRDQVPPPFQPLAADVRVEFALARRDPRGKDTDGVTRTRTTKREFNDYADDIKATATGGRDPWPSDRYLNMWVAPAITDPNIGQLLGYAQFPGGPVHTDGVVIWHAAFGDRGTATSPFDKGRTATHEVGHWLNLLHIWGDDRDGCQRSDEIADTPNQAAANTGRPRFPHITCNNGPHGDMFMNFMDYVDDDCMHMFTIGQVERMRAALAGPRASLATSDGLAPITVAARGRGFGAGVSGQIFDGVGWVTAPALDPQVRGVLEKTPDE